MRNSNVLLIVMKINVTNALARRVSPRGFRKLYSYVVLETLRLRDLSNRIHYGERAPLYCELIYVDTRECQRQLYPHVALRGVYKGLFPGQVVNRWPEGGFDRIVDHWKFKACVRRFRDGAEWCETGVYEHLASLIRKHGSHDDLTNMEDVRKRYMKIDAIFDEVKRSGRLKTRGELKEASFREKSGPRISLGPDGTLYHSGGGHHRFAMAYVLDIPLPACVGVVHREALWKFQELRERTRRLKERVRNEPGMP